MRRLLALAAVLVLVAACSTHREETWIGQNTGVTIDSFAEPPQPAPATPVR